MSRRLAFWLNNRKADEKDSNAVRKNFLAYIEFLQKAKKGEVVAHLASLLEEERFARAMAVLATSPAIITALTDYIKGIEIG